MEVTDTPATSGTLFCTGSMSDSTIWVPANQRVAAVPDMSSSTPAVALQVVAAVLHDGRSKKR